MIVSWWTYRWRVWSASTYDDNGASLLCPVRSVWRAFDYKYCFWTHHGFDIKLPSIAFIQLIISILILLQQTSLDPRVRKSWFRIGINIFISDGKLFYDQINDNFDNIMMSLFRIRFNYESEDQLIPDSVINHFKPSFVFMLTNPPYFFFGRFDWFCFAEAEFWRRSPLHRGCKVSIVLKFFLNVHSHCRWWRYTILIEPIESVVVSDWVFQSVRHIHRLWFCTPWLYWGICLRLYSIVIPKLYFNLYSISFT